MKLFAQIIGTLVFLFMMLAGDSLTNMQVAICTGLVLLSLALYYHQEIIHRLWQKSVQPWVPKDAFEKVLGSRNHY